MEEVLEHLYQDVKVVLKKMVHYVIQNVKVDIQELDLYVGKIVLIHSKIMVLFV